jgi:large subunit ribosomal protein L21
MYAIIRTGGKQYKVQAGDVIRIEKLENELGSELDLTDVLMIGGENPLVGQPLVKNAKVTVVITMQEKDRKVIIFKKKRRQGYRRFKTHRQHFTEVFVRSITSPDGKVVKADSEAEVIDLKQKRADKQAKKAELKEAARGDKSVREEKKSAKKVAKKDTKKAPAKKAVKKKTAAKKGGAKKVTSGAKKTTKKA